MPRSKKTPLAGRVSWERNGGRLQRLDKPALQEDVDLLVYNIDNVNAVALAEHTAEQNQKISLPPVKEASNQSNIVFSFEMLERVDQLDLILSFLGSEDIKNLRRVSLFFFNYIDRNYVLQLSLPVSAAVLENLVNRKVVSLSSCCNLTWLPGIDTFQPFNQLNLTNLRELKLTGKNCDWRTSTFYPNLSQVYHNSVQHLIRKLGGTLRKLEILTDLTERSLDTAESLAGNLVNLEELVMHGIYHFCDGLGGQPMPADTLNLIIQKALQNNTISKLTLERFDIVSDETLIIKSDNLKELSVLKSKSSPMDLNLPSLTSLETDLGLVWDIDGSFERELKNRVEAGCISLQTWNGVNLQEVSRPWADHLALPLDESMS